MRFVLLFLLFPILGFAQNFAFNIELKPKSISGFPGLHSFALGHFQGKSVFVGGRTDGIHARQPFNAFPSTGNNLRIYVVDFQSQQVWSSSLAGLDPSVVDQLQATNFNFIQRGNDLVIVGGYGFSVLAQNHITHPRLTVLPLDIIVPKIMANQSWSSDIFSIQDTNFAVTGGQMALFGDTLCIVGGHRFDGRYNPMGHATYTQNYTNAIRRFSAQRQGSLFQIQWFSPLISPEHLHRRDYNLVPVLTASGARKYVISSGVFQPQVDLPYLYPVEIAAQSIFPDTGFSQRLSNYHSAKVSLFDPIQQSMHYLFLGGISQYQYQNGQVVADVTVPFVRTISRLTRTSQGQWSEFPLGMMPGYLGAGAELVIDHQNPAFNSDEIFTLPSSNLPDSLFLGWMVGGISSSIPNAFTSNSTGSTSANPLVYEVWLKNNRVATTTMEETSPYGLWDSSNQELWIRWEMKTGGPVKLSLTDLEGKSIRKRIIKTVEPGFREHAWDLQDLPSGVYLFHLSWEGKSFSQKILIR
jgi:hypothetical protein